MASKKEYVPAWDEEDTAPSGVDKRRQRRKKARRRAVARLIVFLALVALGLFAWKNWDTLAPDKLLAQIQDGLGDGVGSYPVDVSGINPRRVARCENYTVLLSDSYLTFYNSEGGEINRYATPSSSVLMRQAGSYVLLVEQEGEKAQLYTRSAMIAEVTAEHAIVSASVNSKGQFALLTQGPQGYASQVTVYSRSGKVLYTRSRTQQVTEVALSTDGKQVALVTVQAVNGSLDSSVDVFSLDSTDQEAKCSYRTSDALLYRIEYLDDGWLMAVGEKGAVLLDTSNGLATVFAPADKRLLGYAVGGDTLALVMRDYGDTAGGQVQVINKQGDPLCTVDFSGEFRYLSSDGKRYALLTDTAVQEITLTGAGRQVTVAADGQQAVLCEDNAVVLGLNMLQAYPLK